PAYDLLDLEKYFRLDSPWHFPKSRRAVQYDSSRGCPYHCSYCHTIHGKKYRGMSAAKVVNEIEELVTKHGVEELMVVDDMFNFDLDRRKYDIEVCGFFMIGFPGESLEQIQETLEFAVSAPLDTVFISVVSPFKGTVLRTDMLNGRFGEIDQSGIAALDQLFPTVHNEAV